MQDGPALALYQRRGFLPAGQHQIAPGVTITMLERRGRPAAGAGPHPRPPARG
jgi:hypothetical protein